MPIPLPEDREMVEQWQREIDERRVGRLSRGEAYRQLTPATPHAVALMAMHSGFERWQADRAASAWEFCSVEEMQAWIEAGLPCTHDDVAVALRNEGVTPTMLGNPAVDPNTGQQVPLLQIALATPAKNELGKVLDRAGVERVRRRRRKTA